MDDLQLTNSAVTLSCAVGKIPFSWELKLEFVIKRLLNGIT